VALRAVTVPESWPVVLPMRVTGIPTSASAACAMSTVSFSRFTVLGASVAGSS
jgi:hypothetical protein